MATVKTLLDMGRVKCGTDAELGRRIGFTRAQIADMRSGRKPVSPETVALLCDVLEVSGDECREWVAVSLIENPKNATCADRLRRALFACWVAGVAALMPLNDAQARSGAYTARVDSLYIVAHWWRRWTRKAKAALQGAVPIVPDRPLAPAYMAGASSPAVIREVARAGTPLYAFAA
jgi:transcriptional regulator with XRE-family HTH domain